MRLKPLGHLSGDGNNCTNLAETSAWRTAAIPRIPSRLLVAQGLDRIETGGFDGGVYAEEEAHAHGDAHGEYNGPERNG